MTQAGEHNPYNPSPVYCISPPPCTLSLSLSLWNPNLDFFSFRPTDQGRPHHRRSSSSGASGAKEGSSIFVGASQNQSSSPKTGFSTPDTDIQPQRSWSGRTLQTTHHSERTRATRGPCRGCHQNLEAPNQRCPCDVNQRSRTGSARCAASCCTSPLYLHAATPFAFGALTGVCLTLAYRSVPCVDRNSRTCLA